MFYVQPEQNTGRLLAYSETGWIGGPDYDVELAEKPETLTPENMYDWVCENGALTYDPIPVEDPDLMLDIAADHEYRICLLEMGVTEDDL